MNFMEVREQYIKRGQKEVAPEFFIARDSDLLVKGGGFYAIWDEEKSMWSRDIFDAQRLIDNELYSYMKQMPNTGDSVKVLTLREFSSGQWLKFKKYYESLPDSTPTLDQKLTFADTVVTKSDYVSKRLPYSLKSGPCDAYEEIISTLYDPSERQKIEWAIGAIVAGDIQYIQKFIVLYGPAGAGKSTILNIIEKLFAGYIATFNSKELTGSSNSFATEAFRHDPIVAIEHDGDLSRIEDNTKLNSIVSHEDILMNVKFRSAYTSKANCFLFMATNKPVKITDSMSGVIRRLIDVKPSGHKLTPDRYFNLKKKLDFELGEIAQHCLDVYKELGPHYYSDYKPIDMMYKTDVFFNFVESCYDEFKELDGITLARAYDKYKTYCDRALVEFKLPAHKFREELKNYFNDFFDRTRVDNEQVRSYYRGFRTELFEQGELNADKQETDTLIFDKTESIFEKEYSDCPAQLAKEDGSPQMAWDNCALKLKDIDTSQVHYVRPPLHMIVIDFDIKTDGRKDPEANLKAAACWPRTYGEFSKSGGVHLHYIYDGDVEKLSRVYSEGIEVKVFTGKSSLRRKFTFCNALPIAHINSGLPLKEETKTFDKDAVLTQKALRTLIVRACHKKYHPEGTKPNVDFINACLKKAYDSGVSYDVSDLAPGVYIFASQSTNHSDYCKQLVELMHFKSKDLEGTVEEDAGAEAFSKSCESGEDDPMFFDIESYPNLLLVCAQKQSWDDDIFLDLVNPSPDELEDLFNNYLVGYNCRRYDNHVLFHRYLGGSVEAANRLSQKIVGTKGTLMDLPVEGYGVSSLDLYDCATKKQSLKMWEFEMGITHHEMDIPWNEPVDESLWPQIIDYCHDDVRATKALFTHIKGDVDAHKMLAAMAKRRANDKTNTLSASIVLNGKRHADMRWRDLSKPVTDIDPEMLRFLQTYKPEMLNLWNGERGSIIPCWPGYKFENGVSSYRDIEKIGEGGHVWAKPGMYGRTVTFDVASMHPNSIIAEFLLNGDTINFAKIVKVRLLVKHKKFDEAAKLYPEIAQFLTDPSKAKVIATALKIPINSLYGLTAASFENPFYDSNNSDNIVAKRGALTMIDIRHAVEEAGGTVIHIKTDSIKVVDPTPEITELILTMGKKYGYDFEIEHIFEKICLVNNAVYIAKCAADDPETPGEWEATGAQFQQPYVYKTLFTHEEITLDDLKEMKNVHGDSAIYINANERDLRKIPGFTEDWLRDPDLAKKELDKRSISLNDIAHRRFIGKCGEFTPVLPDDKLEQCGPFVAVQPGMGGGWLEAVDSDGGGSKFVSGSKGYRWMESENVEALGLNEFVDMNYYRSQADDAIATISKFGDFEGFVA